MSELLPQELGKGYPALLADWWVCIFLALYNQRFHERCQFLNEIKPGAKTIASNVFQLTVHD